MNQNHLRWLQVGIAAVYATFLVVLMLWMADAGLTDWRRSGVATFFEKSPAIAVIQRTAHLPLNDPKQASAALLKEMTQALEVDAAQQAAETARLESQMRRWETATQDSIKQYEPGPRPDYPVLHPSDWWDWKVKSTAYELSRSQLQKLDDLKNAYSRQTRYAVLAKERTRSLIEKNWDQYRQLTEQAQQVYGDTRALAEDIHAGIVSPDTGSLLPTTRRHLNTQLNERPWGRLLQCAMHALGVVMLFGLCCRVIFRLLVLARLLAPITYTPHSESR